MDEFVHLHVHTDGSLLDGAAAVTPLVTAAAALGQPAIAATDHGNLFYAYDFVKAARAAGIKPIVGLETYLAPGHQSRTDKTKTRNHGSDVGYAGDGAYTHMTLLATTTASMHRLFQFNSESWATGFYSKPRGDRTLLSQHATGIVGTTGCPSGEVQTLLRMGRYKQALAAAAEFRDIFDPGHFFIELMDHDIAIEKDAVAGLLNIAKDLNLPLLATNDLHYVSPADAVRHDHLLCVGTGSEISDPTRFKFNGSGYYLKTAAEMRALWPDHPSACENTLLVAEMCDHDFATGQDLMPRYPVADDTTEAAVFAHQVWDGLADRYPAGIPEDRKTQADYEIEMITRMGFGGYFLVVADFVNWAKHQGIRVGPGRGSGPGSICAYAMRITDIDPITHGLIFERFLNPDRVSMPDFDIDFDEERRGEVINYVTAKYGADRVAQIVTYGRIKAKQAVKDAARIHGYPFGVGDRLTKAMPPGVMGKDMSLADIYNPAAGRYKEAAAFRALVEESPDTKRVVEAARGIEGLTRSTGVHAAGVIMSAVPLTNVIPTTRRPADGVTITQFEYAVCEELGMVKMDFLGLANLTTIEAAIGNIKRNRGITIDVDHLTNTLDDPAAYNLLARGDTLGVFQLDGGPMRSLLRSMKPDKFEDISAVLALYRPGPMGVNAHNDYADRKNDRKPVVPIHPELGKALEPHLGDTYGLIVYQEQVMSIAQDLAGYTLGGADLLRRAMGKKKKSELDKQYATFEAGMRANGYSTSAITKLWETLVPFSDYAFNKAHTAAYGVISYQTAYLKANYPTEYMAALLTTNIDDKDKTAIYLNEARRMGIRVLTPDVNESVGTYTAVGDDIRVGFQAIRGLGAGVAAAIVATRSVAGRYESFTDFLDKVEPVVCRKQVVQGLIMAGGFDSLHPNRRALDMAHAQAVDAYAATKSATALGQDSLFDGLEDNAGPAGVAITLPQVADWDRNIRLAHERNMLGLYVSDHPLSGMTDALRARTEQSVGEVLTSSGWVGKTIVLGGLITDLARKVTKKGDAWASFTLEDTDGTIDVLAFSQTYQAAHEVLQTDAIVAVTGRADLNEDGTMKFIATSVRGLRLDDPLAPLVLTIQEPRLTAENIDLFKGLLIQHKGTRPVRIQVVGAASTKVSDLPQFAVDVTPALVAELKTVFGVACLNPTTTAASSTVPSAA